MDGWVDGEMRAGEDWGRMKAGCLIFESFSGFERPARKENEAMDVGGRKRGSDWPWRARRGTVFTGSSASPFSLPRQLWMLLPPCRFPCVTRQKKTTADRTSTQRELQGPKRGPRDLQLSGRPISQAASGVMQKALATVGSALLPLTAILSLAGRGAAALNISATRPNVFFGTGSGTSWSWRTDQLDLLQDTLFLFSLNGGSHAT